MTTTKESKEKKPLSLSRPGRLELKKTVETGQVRQSFSHGRSKAVTVEVKRSRTFERGESGRMKEVVRSLEEEQAAIEELEAGAGTVPSRLSEHERQSRMRALEISKEEAARRSVEDAEREALEAQQRLEEEKRLEAEAQSAREAEAQNGAAQTPADGGEAPSEPVPTAPADAPPPPDVALEGATPARAEKPAKAAPSIEEELGGRVKRKTAVPKPPSAKRGAEERRRAGKLTISQALEGDDGRQHSLAAVRRRREKQLRAQREEQPHQPPKKVVREVVVPETIEVQELANRMAVRGVDVIKALMKMGVIVTGPQIIDADTAELVVEEFGHKIKRVSAADVEIGIKGDQDQPEDLSQRPPVVTVMGHVDHGKTSLLDALRETDIVAREAGGITQHIGAYQIELSGGGRITFIDTPGHAAFTEMRSRGANVTDIVVLVVAADDGIKEQTVEAINHAKAAEVPIIVAINKMDRPEANPDRVKQELLSQELVVEGLGGEILAVEVSAKEKTGLDKLEEAILLQAELLELKANPNRPAEGVVVEAKLERGRGAVATVLIQRGTLRVGDIFVVGAEWGRVRALNNDRGETVNEAIPAMPVEVLGLNGAPLAGDDFNVTGSEARAREVSEFRRRTRRDAEIAASGRGTLEQMLNSIKEGEARELPVIVKSDVQGSVEAIVSSLEKLGNEEVKARILHSGVGGVNESDVTLARATNALIVAFNVRANPQARELARHDNIDIRYYSIIYNVVDDLKAMLSGMLAPTKQEEFLGYAEIREVFNITKVGKVAGCMVTDGLVRRGTRARLLRDNVVIHEGALKSLRRFKEEVKEVKEGYECGMAFENYNDIQIGDQIECFAIEEIAREL
jgi:translation initiation factor IF-2